MQRITMFTHPDCPSCRARTALDGRLTAEYPGIYRGVPVEEFIDEGGAPGKCRSIRLLLRSHLLCGR